MEESGEDEDDDEEDGSAHARDVFVVFEVGESAIVGACEEHDGCLLEGMMVLICLAAWTAVAAVPVVICIMIACWSVEESLEGQPEEGIWQLGRML